MSGTGKIFLTVPSSSCWSMRFAITATRTGSATSPNCSLWVRQNPRVPQLICSSKNSAASQSEWHEACDPSYSFSIRVLNEARDPSYSFGICVLNEACDPQLPGRSSLHSFILFSYLTPILSHYSL